MKVESGREPVDSDCPVDLVSLIERAVWAAERAMDDKGVDLEAMVREILREIRRPSDQMIISGNAQDCGGVCAPAILHWQAMIDEAVRR